MVGTYTKIAAISDIFYRTTGETGGGEKKPIQKRIKTR